MGRQISVVMTEKDEQSFLIFLRGISDIQIFLEKASSPELFAIDSFTPRSPGAMRFIIWNKDFAWTPQFAPMAAGGGFYLKNYTTGPVIEYDRDSLSVSLFSNLGHGRLYWPKVPAPTNQSIYSYDHEKFNDWYEKIARWVKKHGRLRSKKPFLRYFLPDAFLRHGSRWVYILRIVRLFSTCQDEF